MDNNIEPNNNIGTTPEAPLTPTPEQTVNFTSATPHTNPVPLTANDPVHNTLPANNNVIGLDPTTLGTVQNGNTEVLDIVPEQNATIPNATEPSIQASNNPGTGKNGKEKKNKKPTKNKMFVFIIVILLLMAGVGFGVYYYLNMGTNSTGTNKGIVAGNVTHELGTELSTNPEDYATFNNNPSANCVLDTSNIDINTVAEYEYIVTCGVTEYKGKFTVIDTTAPVVTTKEVSKVVGDTISAEEFIDICDDLSNCNYKFVDEDTVMSYLESAGGPYTVKIKVSDDLENSTEVEAILNVTSDTLSLYLNCTSPSIEVTGYNATKTISNKLGFNDTFQFAGVASRIYLYTFTSSDEYNTLKSENTGSTITFDGISGTAIFSDPAKTLTVVTSITEETLKNEYGSTFPSALAAVRAYYVGNSYTCEMIR